MYNKFPWSTSNIKRSMSWPSMEADIIYYGTSSFIWKNEEEEADLSRLQLISLLKRKNEFISQTKNETDRLLISIDDVDSNNLLKNEHYVDAVQSIEGVEHIVDDPINTPVDQNRIRLISFLEKRYDTESPLPLPVAGARNRIRFKNKMNELVKNVLTPLRNDFHRHLCENYDGDHYTNDMIYYGLDDSRETKARVEATVRLFSDVLVEKEKGHNNYPIHCAAHTRCFGCYDDRCNIKAVSFIPIVVGVAIELGLFEEEKRGGLLLKNGNGVNVLQLLMLSDRDFQDKNIVQNHEHHELVDDKYLRVLKHLIQIGCFKKEDIGKFNLIRLLFTDTFDSEWDGYSYFPIKRFQFLVEWNPIALSSVCSEDKLPLHQAIESWTIKEFRIVFEHGIDYFYYKKGISLLFKKGNFEGQIPIQMAFEKFGRDQVMKMIEDGLNRYSVDTRLDIAEALITAVIDENIDLDCVYFLLRRQPDVIGKLLSKALQSQSPLSALASTAASVLALTESSTSTDN